MRFFVKKRKSRSIGRLFHISSIPANTITSLKERSLQQ
nr:MAG TPA: Mu DNA-binding domain [Caudoviricetes sp.]